MSPLLNSIGPITVPATWEPFTVAPGSMDDVKGGVPIKCSFRVQSRTDAERILELANNPYRRQRIGSSRGVLEWVECDGALARWRGWWLIDSAGIALASRQWRMPSATSYVPIDIDASFLGSQGRPCVIATHRALPNDYALAGVALMSPLFPSRRVEGAGTLVSRAGEGATLDARKQSTKREALRYDATQFDATVTALRPVLLDAAGAAHFGPGQIAQSAAAIQLKTNLVRVTLQQTANKHWLVEGYVGGAWTQLAALRVRRTAASAGHVWSVVGTEVLDDRVAVVLTNDYDATTLRAEIRIGERGLRLTALNASYYVQLLAVNEAVITPAAFVQNYWRDSAAGPGGAYRFTAFLNTLLSSDTPTWTGQLDVGDRAMVGYEPPAAGADDTAAEQSKQLVYDRTELLTVV